MATSKENCEGVSRSTAAGFLLGRFTRVNDGGVDFCGEVARMDSARETFRNFRFKGYLVGVFRSPRNKVQVVLGANGAHFAYVRGGEFCEEEGSGNIKVACFFFRVQASVDRRIRLTRQFTTRQRKKRRVRPRWRSCCGGDRGGDNQCVIFRVTVFMGWPRG